VGQARPAVEPSGGHLAREAGGAIAPLTAGRATSVARSSPGSLGAGRLCRAGIQRSGSFASPPPRRAPKTSGPSSLLRRSVIGAEGPPRTGRPLGV